MKSKKLLKYREYNKNKFLSKKLLFGGAAGASVVEEPIFNNPSGLGLAPIEFSIKNVDTTKENLEKKHKKNNFFEKEDEEWNGDIDNLCQEVFSRKILKH